MSGKYSHSNTTSCVMCPHLTFRWYHGTINGREAETLLIDKGGSGSFLVRASTHSPGDYVLSAQVDGEVSHVIIKQRDGKFDVGGGPTFSELQELVEHYKKTPLVETTGRVIHLKRPFHATSFLPSSIKQRFSELEKQTEDVYGKAAFWEEFEVCIPLLSVCLHLCQWFCLREKKLDCAGSSRVLLFPSNKTFDSIHRGFP